MNKPTKEDDEYLEKLAMILVDVTEKEIQEEALLKSSKTSITFKKYF